MPLLCAAAIEVELPRDAIEALAFGGATLSSLSRPARLRLAVTGETDEQREPSSGLGKPSMNAATDDCFAQLDVVRLTIPSATKQSRASAGCRSDALARSAEPASSSATTRPPRWTTPATSAAPASDACSSQPKEEPSRLGSAELVVVQSASAGGQSGALSLSLTRAVRSSVGLSSRRTPRSPPDGVMSFGSRKPGSVGDRNLSSPLVVRTRRKRTCLGRLQPRWSVRPTIGCAA